VVEGDLGQEHFFVRTDNGADQIHSRTDSFSTNAKRSEVMNSKYRAVLIIVLLAVGSAPVIAQDADGNSNYKRSFGVKGEVSDRRAAKVRSLAT